METTTQNIMTHNNIDTTLWGTSKAFERKAKTIKNEIAQHLNKNPNQTSYKWDGSNSGFLGIIFTTPDFSHPLYKTTDGFIILQQICDELGYAIKECKITKNKYGENGNTIHYEANGLEFVPK